MQLCKKYSLFDLLDSYSLFLKSFWASRPFKGLEQVKLFVSNIMCFFGEKLFFKTQERLADVNVREKIQIFKSFF